jgi:hypothetical protein
MRAGAMFVACAMLAAPALPTALDAQPVSTLPPIRHVFTIILENQSFDSTFGVALPAPYLAKAVAGHGALLQQYYATSHYSLGNYLTLISGQAVTRANQDDCATSTQYPELSTNYADIAVRGLAPYSQVMGEGCIYPAATKTIADQLTARGLTWHGYMEDMGNDATRETMPCGQPIGGVGSRRRHTKAAARSRFPISTPPNTTRSCISIRCSIRTHVTRTSGRSAPRTIPRS